MTTAERLSGSDAGESLIEILLTIVVIGVAGVGLVAGLTTEIIGNDSHRRLSDVEVVTRAYGETVKEQLLRQPATTLTQPVAAHNPWSIDKAYVDLHVQDATVFGAMTNFSVAVDGEIFTVVSTGSDVLGSYLHTQPGGASGHASGASVAKYSSCPTLADAQPSFSAPNADHVDPPSVTSIEYFSSDGTQKIGEMTTADSAPPPSCTDYWATPPSICAATGQHLTECDPALIRVTFGVQTNASISSGAATTTSILVRRVA